MRTKLSFHDGKFKILAFSDSQDKLNGPDPRTLRAMRCILDDEKPDLVVMNGDLCDNDGTPHTEEEFIAYSRRLMEPMEERGIWWCHTFGNHDHRAIDKEIQQCAYESLPHCLSESGPKGVPGIGNYVLPILSSDGSKTAYAVWGLDSHNNLFDVPYFSEHPEIPFRYKKMNLAGSYDYDFIKFEQIEWYYHTSQALERENGGLVPGLMFFHIALPEHRIVVGNPEEAQMQGEYNEDICNSPINSGVMAAVLQRGDITGIFVGHDHANEFFGNVHGVQLGYEGSIGYGHYGLPDGDPRGEHYLRGGRVFVIDEKDPRHHRTYMRYAREFGL